MPTPEPTLATSGTVTQIPRSYLASPPLAPRSLTVSSTLPISWRAVRALVVTTLFVPLVSSSVSAQVRQAGAADPASKRAMTIDDYARWKTIEGAQLSGDGKWVAYVLRLTNVPTTDSKPVLHILNLDNNQDVTVADATNPTFSPDSRWVTYAIDPPAPRGGRGGRGGATTPAPTDAPVPAVPAVPADTTAGGRGAATPPPLPRRVELRELATGKLQSWQDIQSATFSPTSSHLLLRRRPPSAPGAAGAGAGAAPAPAGPALGGRGGGSGAPDGKGTDALLHNLATGHTLVLGSVDDAAFNRKGEMLAYTVGAAVRDGNGLFVTDLKTGTTHALDNDAKIYSRVAFNDDGTALAALKAKEVPKMREHETMLVVFPNVRAAVDAPATTPLTLDPSAASSFPKGFVVSDRAPLSWSDDGKRIFFGMIPQTAAPDTARRKSADSVADVDIWRASDDRVQSVQMFRADADRNFAFREAFDVASSKFVRLADSSMKDLEVAADGKWAVGRDTRAYTSDYEPARADFYRVNPATGDRTLMFKGQLAGQQVFGISPNGKHFVYWKDAKFQDYDLDAGTSKPLGNATTPSFVDTQFDHPGPKPPFGVTGYAKDGSGVIVEHRFDLWMLPFDGSAPRNLTEGLGTKQEIKFLPARTEQPDPMAPRADRDQRAIDLSKPVTLSAYGEWTKKAGYYELSNGKLKELVYEDASFSTPLKAAKADKFLLTRQTFAEFPDLRIAGYGFKDSKKITDANPQQAEFLWGHRVLFDYKLPDGQRAQGILAIPDNYKTGEKRPMIVSFYEKNSQNMHRYSAPSFVTGMGALPVEAVTHGYILMFADVYYHNGRSHSDQLEAVEAATKKVIELGYADPKAIGLNGHSYGGEGAGFIATRSKLFRAVGVGAGVSDLYTDFTQSWGWSYQNQPGTGGANAFDYYIYGQGRWGFSPWDKPEIYHYESSLTHAPETQAAVLIMHGTSDPTVSFLEGLNFYTALRYNKKDATLLAYVGEGHGLRGLANRKDLTIRYMQFFDHYLKGAPAPKWMTDGVPYLVKEAAGSVKP
jgi:dipeptidyl aminopeptidase/acylaminoacyl peptidase